MAGTTERTERRDPGHGRLLNAYCTSLARSSSELGGVEWEITGGGDGLLAFVRERGTCIRNRKRVEWRSLADAQIEIDEAVEGVGTLVR